MVLLGTESRNSNSEQLDLMSVREIIELMNEETEKGLRAVENASPNIEALIEEILNRDSGRIIYAGAGTSGRLGVLDASECPPTFHTDPEAFIGLIAGGEKALRFAIEGAEDSIELGAADIESLGVSSGDCVIGIAASGRTPYVKGVLESAKEKGALTASVSNNTGSEISKIADFAVEVDSGAEIISGSTRLKAGTTQKLVLNMISTIVNIKRGKVYGNFMIDVSATNEKLENRAVNMISDITGEDRETSKRAYRDSGRHVKTAVVSLILNVGADEAEKLIAKEPNIRKIIK
ncbi:N-acetylmuramic acid 6-phosphate etherase [Corticicoccus populi]|uniref:N-acetylmuramic acid 6-phosphate etherase n=1 Tax=Corticicoccus populi TaxID=1812821 RepID=A0ABW5WX63_9STAP